MAARVSAPKLKRNLCHGFIVTIKTPERHSRLFRRTNLRNEADVVCDLLTGTHDEEPGRRPVLAWARTYVEAHGNRVMTENGFRPLVSMRRVTPDGGLTVAEVEELRMDFHRDFDHKAYVLLDRPVALKPEE